MLPMLARLMLCLALAGALPPAARAQDGAGAAHDTGQAFGALRAVFYHELGHALIERFGLGVVGPEEAVADEFSTMVLILHGRRDARQIEALLSAARFWSLSARPGEEAMRFYDAHEFGARRFFGILCLLHGSDPARFAPVMAELGIPQDRVRRCEYEYRQKAGAWIGLLAPHVRGAGGGRFAVSYERARTPGTEAVARLWQQSRFLESLAEEAGALFRLPADLPVRAQDCGEANAWWDGRAIVICYEMHEGVAREFARLRQDRAAAGAAPARPGGGIGIYSLGDLLGEN